MRAFCGCLVSAFSVVTISAHTVSIILVIGVAASYLFNDLLVFVLDMALKYFFGRFADSKDVSLLLGGLSICSRGLLNFLIILDVLDNRIEYF